MNEGFYKCSDGDNPNLFPKNVIKLTLKYTNMQKIIITIYGRTLDT